MWVNIVASDGAEIDTTVYCSSVTLWRSGCETECAPRKKNIDAVRWPHFSAAVRTKPQVWRFGRPNNKLLAKGAHIAPYLGSNYADQEMP